MFRTSYIAVTKLRQMLDIITHLQMSAPIVRIELPIAHTYYEP
ncbi:13000_t:CDS:1, partial [Cetraspora pellucida]